MIEIASKCSECDEACEKTIEAQNNVMKQELINE